MLYDDRHNHVRRSPLTFTADDGRELAATWFEPTGDAIGAVLLAPAMATPAAYYAAFATWLASHGYRTLTFDVGTDVRAAAIVRHTVALAHDLGISLVAEGVEDDATAAVLRRLGCDVAQGYAIARPMPVDAFLQWLDTPRRPLGLPDRSARA